MRKLLSVLTVGIICGMLAPAWALPTRANEPRADAPRSLVPEVESGGRAIVPRIPRDEAFVDITGKLEPTFHLWDYAVPLAGRRLPMPLLLPWQVRVKGQVFALDLGAIKEFQAQAEKLNGQMVVVSGSLSGGSVRVTRLRAADKAAVPEARVELWGTLRYSELERFPPIPVWEVTAGGKTYRLSLATAELQKHGRDLSGQRVVVRGTLQGDAVAVTHLEANLIRFELATY
jgi:hypothetical protein